MRIDYIFDAKLVFENLTAILGYTNYKVLALVGPVGIANPKRVFAFAWYFEVLIKSGVRFVCTGSGQNSTRSHRPVSTLRIPWTIDSPPGSFVAGIIQIRRIEDRVTKLPVVKPRMFSASYQRYSDETGGLGDGVTRRVGDAVAGVTRRRGDAETRRCAGENGYAH